MAIHKKKNGSYTRTDDRTGHISGNRPADSALTGPTANPVAAPTPDPTPEQDVPRSRRLSERGTGGMLTAMDLQSMPPNDIDTQLAELYYEEMVLQTRLASARDSVRRAAGARQVYTGRRQAGWNLTYPEAVTKCEQIIASGDALAHTRRYAEEALQKVQAAEEKLVAVQAKQVPLQQEFTRRGGWTRAFLVVNNNGHVHSSMNCSTCFPTTRYEWKPEYSGADENEIVAAAGERACTVCYPSAPTDLLSRPTSMWTREEIAEQAAREERDRARAERQRKQRENAPTKAGEPLTVMVGTRPSAHETFKTERAATNWYLQQKASDVYYAANGMTRSPEYYGHVDEAYEIVEAALADKHGITVEEQKAILDQKLQAKLRRESR